MKEKPPSRAGWLLVTALLATTAIALSFVDAAGPRPSAAVEMRPGFYAVFGLCAAVTLAMLARALRLALGRSERGDDDPDRA
ncbi:MAG: hypothetical protein JNJ73_00380 [Hyphomonadaceae bacterium]|nr:hypothetical protein [Hyphomonadaceae bacterium]